MTTGLLSLGARVRSMRLIFWPVAALLAINAFAIWGIFAAVETARAGGYEELRLQALAQARALEAGLASLRGDFIFLSQSAPVANGIASLSSTDPMVRRWSRLDVEGSLLLFLQAHPEVESIVVRGPDERPLAIAARREGAPVLLPPGPSFVTSDDPELILGRWPVGSASGGLLEARIDPAHLIAAAAPGSSDRLSLQPGTLSQAGFGETQVATAPLSVDDWDPPIRRTLVRNSEPSRLLGSIESLAGRYRTTVILNLAVVALTIVLGIAAFRQIQRSLVLEAEGRHQVRVRELERQVQHSERLSSVGKLAAGFAHEINNPLEGMANYLSLLEDDLRSGRTDGAADLAARVREGLERAAGVTRQVLAFADPGKTQPVRVDLNGVLRDAVSFLRSNPAFRRTEVSFVPAGDGLFVLGNPVTLGQLFLNLLINALQFQPAGGLIEVVAGAGERTAIVSVTDHGPGIRPEDLPRIFEPFFSTRGSTGLGLSVCQAIALAHGGNITAENREEGGACFRVEIPLDAPGVPVADEAQAPAGRRGIAAAGAPMPERGLPVESLSFPEER